MIFQRALQNAEGLVFKPKGLRVGWNMPKDVTMAQSAIAASSNLIDKNALQISIEIKYLNLEA
jgi:hypothetical protein